MLGVQTEFNPSRILGCNDFTPNVYGRAIWFFHAEKFIGFYVARHLLAQHSNRGIFTKPETHFSMGPLFVEKF
jgi:hypothetical protein